ncbi:Arl5-family small GTPase [Coccomyxa subellipsoidea C-169]|uniref:Arl5-family small GTPase n=1 Tax=Coccomyxa subellipsoidea (strain C-169) TaxID=574566 RepID=I0YU48_COCSC|nr:Arl5-family small GTPase [Coccomyxa subellipsoidea C-169]EIE21917.1 Arl5-family small GTPase [Coccomyxa subellipsoidea C-169]|eukprot:XP_005646461.1 Arl5-family small GTPase [Coccomyxa subellipsoidea C-169]
MGQLFSLIAQYLFPNKEYKIVMVGLDNAGKTTTLYRLHLGEAVVTQPTVGSNVECVQYKNLKFEVWDLGGQANLRPSWATYYRSTDAVIVVIDSTDRARASIAKNELFNLLDHEHLAEAAILIMANKQDLKDAMTVKEMSDVLALHSIKRHDWHIQAACAKTGEGLMEGMEWIAQRVKGEAASTTPLASPTPSPAKPLAPQMRA